MKRYICLIVIALAVFACNNDDDGTPENNTSFEGTWSLVNVTGGLLGVNQDFNTGLITWDFDIQTQQVAVVNNNTELVYDGFPTGTYDFEAITNGDLTTILIDNSYNMVIVTLNNSQLVLDDGVGADGFLYTLTR